MNFEVKQTNKQKHTKFEIFQRLFDMEAKD